MSNIRASVRLEKSVVFAGEPIKCTITFTNASPIHSAHSSTSPNLQSRGTGSARERWKETLPLHNRNPRTSLAPGADANIHQTSSLGHRSTLSLQSSVSGKQLPTSSLSSERRGNAAAPGHKHKHSISIVSINGDTSTTEELHLHGQPAVSLHSGRRHGRSASLQILPSRMAAMKAGPLSASANIRSTTAPSPLIQAPAGEGIYKTTLASAPKTSFHPTLTGSSSRSYRSSAGALSPAFAFPPVSASSHEATEQGPESYSNTMNGPHSKPVVLQPHQDLSNGLDHIDPVSRTLSSSSINGTPRSSGEFYSMSNYSTETLASEYVDQRRLVPPRISTGQGSNPLTTPTMHYNAPETLMMGYGQITGSFIVDSSLINQAPFEEVKRKGVIGGQGGGGVVGVDNARRDGGLFGALGWSNIGESLGGLLGGSELSSIKEMKSIANAKPIPILSTTQSILFVDLRLSPGQSRSYTYTYSLPAGIPPSHKGRCFRVSYSLLIGTQRAGISTQHLVRSIEVPFRVLPGVDGQGELMSHDLMSPFIILQDKAQVVRNDIIESLQLAPKPSYKSSHQPSNGNFLAYANQLLDKARRASSFGLLSPTDIIDKSLTHASANSSSVSEAVDLAILRSNSVTSTNRSANRFDITRNGQRIAVIMLTRPAYRLGETVCATVDFDDSEVTCYSLRALLESSEIIDPAIALRSRASIERATRRVYASTSDLTIVTRRAVFNPTISIHSTPTFVTSGIRLEWRLRFQFLTRSEEMAGEIEGLMEEVGNDERGSAMAAMQSLSCESFDVTIPIQVYGAATAMDEKGGPVGSAI